MKTTTSLVLLVLAAALPACGGQASDVCDEICNHCESCNDRDVDECNIEVQANIDIAEDYGCDQEVADVYDCFIRKYHCTNDKASFGTDCASEREDLGKCEDRGSSLDN